MQKHFFPHTQKYKKAKKTLTAKAGEIGETLTLQPPNAPTDPPPTPTYSREVKKGGEKIDDDWPTGLLTNGSDHGSEKSCHNKLSPKKRKATNVEQDKLTKNMGNLAGMIF